MRPSGISKRGTENGGSSERVAVEISKRATENGGNDQKAIDETIHVERPTENGGTVGKATAETIRVEKASLTTGESVGKVTKKVT